MCTWNILFGIRLPKILEAVHNLPDFHNLDLFALQEASVHGGRPDAEAIAEAMGPGFEYFQATAQTFRGREQANALIWRRGLFSSRALHVLSLDEIDVSRFTRVERALLRAMPPQKRIAIRAEAPDLRVYVMHLDVVGFARRLEQFRAIVTDLTNRPPVRLTLIAGDLNTIGPPRLQLWRRIRQSAHEVGLVELTRGIKRTHWTAQKLDAIYAAGEISPRHHAWTRSVRASDHLPVFAEF
jgi:endonuclease/exonuclease/phosphatase family metal-dependent hydrolase